MNNDYEIKSYLNKEISYNLGSLNKEVLLKQSGTAKTDCAALPLVWKDLIVKLIWHTIMVDCHLLCLYICIFKKWE